eukprot:scaffold9.g3163.t1
MASSASAMEGYDADSPQFPPNLLSESDWTLADFHSLVEVGKGKDTVIYSAICPRLGNRKVALKQYDKTKVQPTKYRAIKREIAMMLFFARKQLPSVVDFYAAFHDDTAIYIVMEYCSGGECDLLEKLLRDKKAMNEKRVALEIALPCLSILQQLHEMRIIHRRVALSRAEGRGAAWAGLGDWGGERGWAGGAECWQMRGRVALPRIPLRLGAGHQPNIPLPLLRFCLFRYPLVAPPDPAPSPRDIKLENIFIDEAGRVKLGDFGLTMSMRQESAISPVGTVEYMAPEVVALPPVDLVISGKIKASDIPPTNEKVDIWALGVTIYELVTGRLPFEGKDKPEIKKNITANNLATFPSFLSPQCQAFIRAMLTYRPSERPSCAELLRHPYIAMYIPLPKPQLPGIISVQAFTAGGAAVPGIAQLAVGSGSSAGSASRTNSLSSLPAGRPASYRDMLAGAIAQAAPNPGTPRSPGGNYIPITVTKGRKATSVATPSGYGLSACDCAGSPHAPQEPLQAGAAPPVSSRKLSFRSLLGKGSSAKASKGERDGALSGCPPARCIAPRPSPLRMQGPAGDEGGMVFQGEDDGAAGRDGSWTSAGQGGYQFSPLGAGQGSARSEKKRGSGMMQGIRALFAKGQGHRPLGSEDDMQQ